MSSFDSIIPFFSGVEIEQTIALGELLNAFVLVLTLLTLLIYTIATLGLWKEARLQSYLSISPLLIFEINGNNFFIRNVGNGAALNISMDDLRIFVKDTPKRNVLQLVFEEVNTLESKDRKQLTFRNYQDGKETSADISPYLNPKYQKKSNQIFILLYTNTVGIRYYTKFRTGKDGIRVLKIARLKLRNQLEFWIKSQIEEFRLKWWQRRRVKND